MLINPDASRRHFLRAAAGFAAAGIGAPLALNLAGLTAASAQTAAGYRAIVCLYLGGGNDSFNSVVAYDTPSYNAYAAARPGVTLDRSTLLPIALTSAQGGRQVALNPALSGIKTLYEANRAAVIASVGNLIVPLTKSRVYLDPTPAQIGSHNDQAAQAMSSRSGTGGSGWGGLIGDALAANNGKAVFTSVSASGYARFLDTNRGYFTAGDRGAPEPYIGIGTPLDRAITGSASRTNLLEKAIAQVNEVSRDSVEFLRNNVAPESQFPGLPGEGLARQLQSVARIIATRSALGARRQVFYVEMGGYDTHSNQLYLHNNNMRALDSALVYFDTMLGQLGLRDSVTLFTTAEFGRTIVGNGDGTDHGWGSHHFVTGGALTRGDVFGKLPDPNPNGPDFIGGPLVPTTANVQLAATLGKWMGASDTDLNRILPDLGNFASRDLGLLRA